MKIFPVTAIALAAAIALPGLAVAQQGAGRGMQIQQQTQAADDDGTGMPMFGRQLMTPEEMAAHRARMRAATTNEERTRIRAEHHQQMLERARERGVTLPEEPPMRGAGPGRGPNQPQQSD